MKPDPQKRKQEISLAIKAEQEMELVSALLDEWDKQALRMLVDAKPDEDATRMKAAVMAEMGQEFRKQLNKLVETGKMARAQLDRDEGREQRRRQFTAAPEVGPPTAA